ncbi:MAG TPA: stage III sporulation protein J [Lachnospiraceae bacterium]|nr:stage III sporulation protein J [Lachnospiraceae bacterium]
MTGILATQSNTFIIGPIAWLFGKLMNGIFIVLDSIGIQNIGLCIILFTIVMYTLMLPLTIKQQKFSKKSAIMNPELQKIQKKYKNKKDQASMLKQQEEMQAVYDKYGTSPTGGCGTMFLQFPIILGLFAVIQKVPAYVTGIKNAYMPLVNKLLESDAAIKVMETLGKESPILIDPKKFDYTQANTMVDALYKFQTGTWDQLAEKLPDLSDLIISTERGLSHLNSFLGINIAETPMNLFMNAIKTGAVVSIILAVAIPVISALTQWLNMKLMPQQDTDPDNPMASSMKMMNLTMPIFSMVMCFTLPSGIGLYWIASAVVRSIQQLVINRYFDKKSLDEMIEENQKKAAMKREKKGVAAKTLNEMAQKNVRNIEEPKKPNKPSMSSAEKEKKIQQASEKGKNAKAGSLTARANMVRDFNDNKKNEG